MFNFIGVRDFIDFENNVFEVAALNVLVPIETISEANLLNFEVAAVPRLLVSPQITTDQISNNKIYSFNSLVFESTAQADINAVIIFTSTFVLARYQTNPVEISPLRPVRLQLSPIIFDYD